MAKNEAVLTTAIERTATRHAPPQDEVAVRAHEIFLGRGATVGHDLDDWFQAEEELVKKRGNVVPPQRSSLRQ